mgnify:CR=1 FL=1
MGIKIKLSDYVAEFIAKKKVSTVFAISGGASLHLIHSVNDHPSLNLVCTHHEQASALAAISNAKISNNVGICVVTTGPASANAITGLLSAWQDSIPIIFLSGQTRKEQTSYGMKVRQRGSQECNILDVVSPWTKAQYLIDDESDIDSIIKEAIKVSQEPRKGPVWIDIPVNLQWKEVEFNISKNIKKFEQGASEKISLKKSLDTVLEKICNAQKPIFVLGRQNCEMEVLDNFLSFARANNFPIATTWGSAGIVGKKALNVGILGVNGQQASNFAIRASDLIVFIGCHFSVTQAGNNYTKISKSQEFVYVNIDEEELNNLFVKNNHTKLIMDSNIFMKQIIKSEKFISKRSSGWFDFLKDLAGDLSPKKCVDKLSCENYANPHKFISKLYSKLNSQDVVVIDGGGCALYAGFQCLPNDSEFKVICSTAICAMGTGLPEVVGVSVTKFFKRYFCIIGDGSLMFNLQELQTISTNCPPCLIIVINNNGYLAIRHTQGQFLGGRFFGTNSFNKGLEIPMIKKIADTFNFDYLRIANDQSLETTLNKVLQIKKHTILEIISSPSHDNLFTASFTDNKDGTFTPNDIHRMIPFENYDYRNLAYKYNLNLEK